MIRGQARAVDRKILAAVFGAFGALALGFYVVATHTSLGTVSVVGDTYLYDSEHAAAYPNKPKYREAVIRKLERDEILVIRNVNYGKDYAAYELEDANGQRGWVILGDARVTYAFENSLKW